MASTRAAIIYCLSFEDSTLSGVVTTDPGGRTRFGIAEKYNSWATALDFYTAPIPSALIMATTAYAILYAPPLWLPEIANQEVANKLLSLSINAGTRLAIEWLQAALGVPEDGRMGLATLKALEAADQNALLAGIKARAVAYYQQLAMKVPADEIYLKGWIRRAEA